MQILILNKLYLIMNNIINIIFSAIWLYYVLTFIQLTVIGIIIGLYQTIRYKKYNIKHSLIWLFIATIIITLARIYPIVYVPDFGCDVCVEEADVRKFILKFTFGLFGSIAIYAFPIWRCVNSIKKLFI